MESITHKQTSKLRGIGVPVSALLIGLCMGSGYGWSLFVKPLMAQHSWTLTQVTLTSSLCLSFGGLSHLLVGWLADRHPRTMAVIGGVTFGVTLILAGLFAHYGCLFPLYLTYGVIGGFSTALPYLAALSASIKWFPKLRGLISGVCVAGNGIGAVFVGWFIPPLILRFGAGPALMGMGMLFLLICGGLGFVVRNPPDFQQPAFESAKKATFLPWDALRQKSFWLLWLLLFISLCAGMGLITQAAPLAQDMRRISALTAGKLVAMMAVCNGLGRLFWSCLSDKLGRPKTFMVLYATQACCFLTLAQIAPFWLFGAVFSYITFCYGGVVGTMPAFTADIFGGAALGRIYGPLMFAQAIAGLAGPLFYSLLKEATGGYTLSLRFTGIVLIAACCLPHLIVKLNPLNADCIRKII